MDFPYLPTSRLCTYLGFCSKIFIVYLTFIRDYAHLIEKIINRYITRTQSNRHPRGSLPTSSSTFYFKLPYIGHFSAITQKKIRHFIKRYCNDLDIKLVFSSFKIGNLLGVRDPVADGLRSRVVYKFVCAGCNA